MLCPYGLQVLLHRWLWLPVWGIYGHRMRQNMQYWLHRHLYACTLQGLAVHVPHMRGCMWYNEVWGSAPVLGRDGLYCCMDHSYNIVSQVCCGRCSLACRKWLKVVSIKVQVAEHCTPTQ